MRQAVPLNLASFEQRLIDAKNPAELGNVLLDELSRSFERIVLFHLVEGSIRGWMAKGPDLDLERLRRYTCPLAIPSVFLTLEQGGGFFLGRLPTLPAHRRLASFLESGSRTQTLVVPVRLNGRLVCTLFTDRAASAFSTSEVEDVRRVAAQAELAFKRIILRDKILALGSPEEPSAPQN